MCLLRDADEPSPPPGRAAPTVAEVAAAFPQLEVLELIGQGGMGSVYKVRQPALDRVVALKILSPELGRDPAFEERFAREARVLGRLNHPNIVTIYEHGQSGGFFYLIMEYVDGVNLRQAMRAGRFTPQQALAVVPGLCDALEAAHAQGVWHRDIKPENILIDTRGGVKIVDFGIARLVGDPARDFTLTATGAALGSAAYMAPEQHEKPHEVDHRADIYSLGVVIYEMLTGELPLGRFPNPSQRAAVSARIDEIVLQTLEKERALRQQSAGEVKTDVMRAQRERAEPAPAPAGGGSPLTRLPRLVLWSVGLLLGGAVLGGVGAAIMEMMRTAATGGAVILGIGVVAFVLGLIGALWALYEMKRGWMPVTGRWVLIGLSLGPLLAGAACGGVAYAFETTPSGKGMVVGTAGLVFLCELCIFGVLLWLVRPRPAFSPLWQRLGSAALVVSGVSLLAGLVVAKMSDGHWPFAWHRAQGEVKLQDCKLQKPELMKLLRRAAGEHADDYELAVIEPDTVNVTVMTQSGRDLPVNGGSFARSYSHVSSCLERFCDLLPAEVLKGANQTVSPLMGWDRDKENWTLACGLATFAALLAALAGGRRVVWFALGGVVLTAILAVLPVWPEKDGLPRLVTGPPLGPLTASELPPPDFSTPEKAVASVYDAACHGQLDVVRRGMSKALVAVLDKENEWEEFMRRHSDSRVLVTKGKTSPTAGRAEPQITFMTRLGTQVASGMTYAVEEDGGWRLDDLNYVTDSRRTTGPFTPLKKGAAEAAAAPVAPPAGGATESSTSVALAGAPAGLAKSSLPQDRLEFEYQMNDPRLDLTNSLVSFETGSVSALPAELKPMVEYDDPRKTTKAFAGWMRDHAIDAVARVTLSGDKVVKLGLRTFGLWVVSIPETTAKQILSGQNRPGIADIMRSRTFLKQDEVSDCLTEPGRTAFFAVTSSDLSGRQGILEIGDSRENPRGGKVRFTQVGMTPKTSDASAVPAAELEPGSFTVTGEVNRPGRFLLPKDGPTRLIQAVGMAGGFTRIANEGRVRVLHKDGAEGTYKANSTDMAENPLVQPGDVIRVPESHF